MRLRQLAPLAAVAVLIATPVAGPGPCGGCALAAGRPMGVGIPVGLGIPRGPGAVPDPMHGWERASDPGRPDAVGADGRAQATPAAARHERARELWQSNRKLLDFDPDDQLIVKGQVVGLASSQAALTALQSAGFVLRSQSPVEGTEAGMVVLEPPRGLSLRRALKKVRAKDPDGAYDYDHIFFETGSGAAAPMPAAATPQAVAAPTSASARPTVRVGVIDGGVEVGHPALHDAVIHEHGCNGAPRPSAHGTAVASLLLGGPAARRDRPASFEVYAADVYCGAPTGGAVDALVDAFAWLVHERVPVINVSLVGPPNALLERVVALAVARGHLVVAAVGNDGPASPPLYPASYPEVIAVTGVDRTEKVLLEAGRGKHVDFAAPGADVPAARLPDGEAMERGTSFAAPIVAYQLAQLLDEPDPARAQRAVQQLAAMAIDLGAPGFDPVYGHGLVGADMRGGVTGTVEAR